MHIPTSPDRFSYYVKTIHNITPCRTISLETVCHFISLDYLRSVTQRVRSGNLKKYMALPFITAPAVFQKRSVDHIKSYSGIVPIELDHVNTDLRYELFEDPFLNPKLLFVNPSKTGLKLFIKVKNASAEHHDHYFNAILVYLYGKYGLKPNSACRDISRPCFLSHDPEALYSALGFVDSDKLLNMIPPAPCTDEQFFITPHKDLPLYNFLRQPITTSANQQISTSTHQPISTSTGRRHDGTTARGTTERGHDCTTARRLENSTSTNQHIIRSPNQHINCLVYLFNKLNACPAVHLRAISILKRNGWTRKGEYWYRPGSSPEEAHSAVFTRFAPYGIFLFTNFSDDALPFVPNKSYSDCMIIATLTYNGDYTKCIADLTQKFSNQL